MPSSSQHRALTDSSQAAKPILTVELKTTELKHSKAYWAKVQCETALVARTKEGYFHHRIWGLEQQCAASSTTLSKQEDVVEKLEVMLEEVR